MILSKKAISIFVALGITATSICPVFAATGEVPAADSSADMGKVSKVTVTFNGDPTSSKGFTWYTSKKSVGSDLQISLKNDFTYPSAVFSGYSAVPSNVTSEYLHKAVAYGLKPDTTYYFRVGDSSLGLWSDTGTFKTAATKGAFTFIDLADTQANTQDEFILSGDTINKAIATVPDAKFIAINGDWVETGNVESQWSSLYEAAPSAFLNNTFIPVSGNHEKQPYALYDHFNFGTAPNSSVATGVYGSFDYSNAHFVVINTNDNSSSYSDFSQSQLDWMKADITAAKASNKWVILFIHKGPYTTAGHVTDNDIAGPTGVRKMIAPVFANLGVDLVLQGHDHIYARSKPIKADGTASAESIITQAFKGQQIDYQVNPDGVIYLIPNAGGAKVYYKNQKITSTVPDYYTLFDRAEENHSAVYGQDPSDASRPERSMVQDFESITIDGDKLSVITYEIDRGGKIHPDTNPYVIDTFGIIKSQEEKNEIHVDKNNLTDVVAGVYKGGNLISVTNGTGTLIPGTDYTYINKTLTIKKGYLKYYFDKFPNQNLNINLNFKNGKQSTITIYTGATANVIISPEVLKYDSRAGVDASFPFAPNGNFIKSIKNGDSLLIQRIDYTYSPELNQLYIRKGYLETYFTKTGKTLKLTLNFTGDSSKTVKIELKK